MRTATLTLEDGQETRKLPSQGDGGTLRVTLPKSYVRRSGAASGDSVRYRYGYLDGELVAIVDIVGDDSGE